MSTIHEWTPYTSLVTALDTQLSIMGTSVLAISSNFSATNSYLYMDAEVAITTVDLSTQVNPAIYLWVIARTDGTNYEDGGVGVAPARPPDAIVPLRAVNTASQRAFARLMLTTPDQFKLLYQNKSGGVLNSGDGNTLKFYLYSDQGV